MTGSLLCGKKDVAQPKARMELESDGSNPNVWLGKMRNKAEDAVGSE